METRLRTIGQAGPNQRTASQDWSGTRTNIQLRWYLLIWVTLVSLWGFTALWTQEGAKIWDICQTQQYTFPDLCSQAKEYHLGTAQQLPAPIGLLLPFLAVFILCVGIFGLLLWRRLGRSHQGLLSILGYYAIQVILILVAGLVTPEVGIMLALSLYLALILESVFVLRKARSIILVMLGAVLISLVLSLSPWKGITDPLFSLFSALFLFIFGFLFVLGYDHQFRQLLNQWKALENAHSSLEAAHLELLDQATQIEELTVLSERQRMARELHDTLAQGLTGMILQLGVVKAQLNVARTEFAQLILEQTIASGREALAEARQAIEDLRDKSYSPEEFVQTLQERVSRFVDLTNISCECDVELLAQVPEILQEQVLWAMREGLNNITRHAHARHAWVIARPVERELMLEIGDDGEGFNIEEAADFSGHYGLLGLHERARLVNGHLEIESQPGKGTRLQFYLPWKDGTVQL